MHRKLTRAAHYCSVISFRKSVCWGRFYVGAAAASNVTSVIPGSRSLRSGRYAGFPVFLFKNPHSKITG
jgi:hypothetical protein